MLLQESGSPGRLGAKLCCAGATASIMTGKSSIWPCWCGRVEPFRPLLLVRHQTSIPNLRSIPATLSAMLPIVTHSLPAAPGLRSRTAPFRTPFRRISFALSSIRFPWVCSASLEKAGWSRRPTWVMPARGYFSVLTSIRIRDMGRRHPVRRRLVICRA